MKNFYLQLAKKAVEKYIREGKIIQPPKNLPKDFFQKRAGVFVSIYKGKELRGCIGTYLPTKENLAKEIIANAISASSDPRFLPIAKEELPFLSYEVYILKPPKLIKTFQELDPKKYGILIQSLNSSKSALLLPGLEGVDSWEKQVLITLQKARIDPTKEKFVVFKFEVIKYAQPKENQRHQ